MILRKGWPAALVCLAICAAPVPIHAQLTDNLGGLTDANIGGYLAPLNTGLSGTMNAAIFRTGHVPAVGLNFSVGLATMAIGYDDEDRTYMPTNPAGFTPLEPTAVPTVVGAPEGTMVQGQDALVQIYPGGFDLEGFLLAVPELSIGSVFGTRGLLRYISLDTGDSDLGEITYMGYGLQHSISQWLPLLPVDIAAGFFIQNIKLGDDVLDCDATHLNVTASKDFVFVQPYVGIGYDSIETKADYEDPDDPELSFSTTLEKETNAHFTLGVLAKVAPASVFLEFNSGAATGIALGLSFGM